MTHMQRLVMRVIVIATILSLTGCINVISRNPLYDPQTDRCFDSKLVGTWVGSKGETVQIQTRDRAAYTAVIDDDRRDGNNAQPGGSIVFEQEEQPFDLVKFGSRRYVFPCELAGDQLEDSPPSEAQHAVPIAKLKRRGDTLYIRPLDAHALLELAQTNPSQLPHEWQPTQSTSSTFIKGTLILLCTRKQMKSFLRKHDDQLYPDKLTLKRVKTKR
jgi:hypothetical protein